MHANVGTADAWIRGFMAIASVVIAALFNETFLVSLVAILLAILFGGTALTHTCPLYTLLGVNTRAHHSSL
jgi:hypothetical protein